MALSDDHDTEDDIGFDRLFLALRYPMRRRILASLLTRNTRDVDAFESMESDADDAIDAPIEIRLYRHHLPHLSDAGFVDWDREADVITRGPRFDEIAPLIEFMAKHRDELPVGWP
jgi:hypothetical protein